MPEKNSAAVETIQTKKATESNLAELKESKEQKESELDFAEQKGMQKGIRETARKLKELGVADDIIIKSTGISKEEIEKL